jgi:hypothetical protein
MHREIRERRTARRNESMDKQRIIDDLATISGIIQESGGWHDDFVQSLNAAVELLGTPSPNKQSNLNKHPRGQRVTLAIALGENEGCVDIVLKSAKPLAVLRDVVGSIDQSVTHQAIVTLVIPPIPVIGGPTEDGGAV